MPAKKSAAKTPAKKAAKKATQKTTPKGLKASAKGSRRPSISSEDTATGRHFAEQLSEQLGGLTTQSRAAVLKFLHEHWRALFGVLAGVTVLKFPGMKAVGRLLK